MKAQILKIPVQFKGPGALGQPPAHGKGRKSAGLEGKSRRELVKGKVKK